MASVEKRPLVANDLGPYQKSILRLKTGGDNPDKGETFIGQVQAITLDGDHVVVMMDWIVREKKVSLPVAIQGQNYRPKTVGIGTIRHGYIIHLEAIKRKEWVNGERITVATGRDEIAEFHISEESRRLAQEVHGSVSKPQ